jgi:hypothetical protein
MVQYNTIYYARLLVLTNRVLFTNAYIQCLLSTHQVTRTLISLCLTSYSLTIVVSPYHPQFAIYSVLNSLGMLFDSRLGKLADKVVGKPRGKVLRGKMAGLLEPNQLQPSLQLLVRRN